MEINCKRPLITFVSCRLGRLHERTLQIGDALGRTYRRLY
jgi:hypothetical protein